MWCNKHYQYCSNNKVYECGQNEFHKIIRKKEMSVSTVAVANIISVLQGKPVPHQLFADAIMFVKDIDGESGLTGQQKHDKVHADFSALFNTIAPWVISTAIEFGKLILVSKTA